MLHPLDSFTQRAGAIVTHTGGVAAAAHYGHPAAELAACVRAVGLADRCDLLKLEIDGRPEQLAALVDRLAGSPLAPGGAVPAGPSWWCAAASTRVVVLAEPADRMELRAMVQTAIAPMEGVRLTDRSADWAAIALIGKHTVDVLSALGACTDPRLAPPFGPATVGQTRVELLLQSDRRAIMLVDSRQAGALWASAHEVGERFGLSYVGTEAMSRFALVDAAFDEVPAVQR